MKKKCPSPSPRFQTEEEAQRDFLLEPFSLLHFFINWAFLAGGTCVAAAAFLMELLLGCCCRRRRRPNETEVEPIKTIRRISPLP